MHSPKFCHISNLLFSVCQAEHIPCMEQQLYMPGNAFIKFLLVLVLAYLLFFIITSYFSFYFYILLGIIPNNNYTIIYYSCQDKRRKSSLISAFSAFCTMKIFMIFLLFLKTQKLFFFQNYKNHQYVLPKKKICDRIQNNRIRTRRCDDEQIRVGCDNG